MSDWTRRLVGGGLFLAQILLLALVPTADARLEAEALEPHLSGTAAATGVHDSHPSHDHRLCELCRALSTLGEPGVVAGPSPRAPEEQPEPLPIPDDVAVVATSWLLPVSPRAPPTT